MREGTRGDSIDTSWGPERRVCDRSRLERVTSTGREEVDRVAFGGAGGPNQRAQSVTTTGGRRRKDVGCWMARVTEGHVAATSPSEAVALASKVELGVVSGVVGGISGRDEKRV